MKKNKTVSLACFWVIIGWNKKQEITKWGIGKGRTSLTFSFLLLSLLAYVLVASLIIGDLALAAAVPDALACTAAKQRFIWLILWMRGTA